MVEGQKSYLLAVLEGDIKVNKACRGNSLVQGIRCLQFPKRTFDGYFQAADGTDMDFVA